MSNQSILNAIRTLEMGQKAFLMLARLYQKIYFNLFNFSFILRFCHPLTVARCPERGQLCVIVFTIITNSRPIRP